MYRYMLLQQVYDNSLSTILVFPDRPVRICYVHDMLSHDGDGFRHSGLSSLDRHGMQII